MTTGRVYVRFGKDYQRYLSFKKFDSLLKEVAFSVGFANGRALVKNDAGKDVACLVETKKYIATEATQLVNRIRRVRQGDHMALHVSKRQINRLIRVAEKTGTALSCYSLVILHIMYINICANKRTTIRNDLVDLERLIYNLANRYLHDNPNDDLAQYIVDCHAPVDNEINGGATCYLQHFPDIHSWF